LCDRVPMTGAHQHARGRVALLGDAAHPMRPYMAQGAGMAIEDAACLQRVLSLPDRDMEQRLQLYAAERWARNARVQARSIRNGEIFHAKGLVRWGRDLAMGLLGERLLDVPWLYQE
nr:FAD-dependent monooxygenase [Rhodoferax sp.]